ncbi:hypothetical protein CLV63_12169 [Murinocardiopsis flavida]|uniref:LPXTG-motif cell wall-anchored protein n=1 Tax=Murinocardiopsis flavida TaxID=645275 RepID=A0A2P8D147_9ACTN|nr:hypothetical protein [Murinocardiopsis flavida]PSK90943.1 hypothetical protein CLV63_12169 [Murinocardiopsis flavida]
MSRTATTAKATLVAGLIAIAPVFASAPPALADSSGDVIAEGLCGNAVSGIGLTGAACDGAGAVPVQQERPAVPERSAPEVPRVHTIAPASPQQGAEREESNDESDSAPAAAPRADAQPGAAGSPAPMTAESPLLPLTGSNLMALVAVALTAVVGAAGALLLGRGRRSAAG